VCRNPDQSKVHRAYAFASAYLCFWHLTGARAMLSRDELQREWVRAQPNTPHDYEGVLVTLMYADEEGRSRAIGNGFVVYAHESSAICLTAAHNFAYIKALQRGRRMPSHPSLPPDFAAKGTQYLDSRGVHSFYVRDGRPVACKVDQVTYQENYDVAAFSIHFEASPETPKAFLGKAAVDFAMPQTLAYTPSPSAVFAQQPSPSAVFQQKNAGVFHRRYHQ
jgi:hypothetical protein